MKEFTIFLSYLLYFVLSGKLAGDDGSGWFPWVLLVCMIALDKRIFDAINKKELK